MRTPIERLLWAANGAAGWATLAAVSAVVHASRLELREAAKCAAWVPTAALGGACAGILGLPSFFGPMDVLQRFSDARRGRW